MKLKMFRPKIKKIAKSTNGLFVEEVVKLGFIVFIDWNGFLIVKVFTVFKFGLGVHSLI